MFENLLNHRCDIYHAVLSSVKIGYGINAARVMGCPDKPDITDVRCHFHINVNDNLRVMQEEPYPCLEGVIKLTLPFGTKIHENDYVRSRETGYLYRAEVPRAVHGDHHLIVNLRREDGIKGAI